MAPKKIAVQYLKTWRDRARAPRSPLIRPTLLACPPSPTPARARRWSHTRAHLLLCKVSSWGLEATPVARRLHCRFVVDLVSAIPFNLILELQGGGGDGDKVDSSIVRVWYLSLIRGRGGEVSYVRSALKTKRAMHVLFTSFTSKIQCRMRYIICFESPGH